MLIHHKWAEGVGERTYNMDATQYSFWLARNMPFQDSIRHALLEKSSTQDRLNIFLSCYVIKQLWQAPKYGNITTWKVFGNQMQTMPKHRCQCGQYPQHEHGGFIGGIKFYKIKSDQTNNHLTGLCELPWIHPRDGDGEEDIKKCLHGPLSAFHWTILVSWICLDHHVLCWVCLYKWILSWLLMVS